jgi:hypothetical protein
MLPTAGSQSLPAHQPRAERDLSKKDNLTMDTRLTDFQHAFCDDFQGTADLELNTLNRFGTIEIVDHLQHPTRLVRWQRNTVGWAARTRYEIKGTALIRTGESLFMPTGRQAAARSFRPPSVRVGTTQCLLRVVQTPHHWIYANNSTVLHCARGRQTATLNGQELPVYHDNVMWLIGYNFNAVSHILNHP